MENKGFVQSEKGEKFSLDNGKTGVDGTIRMERQIGLLGGISLILGMMIGSGIFISPTGLLENTGSASLSLVVWAACGVLSTLAALTYCELGAVIPKSGGEHAYFMETYTPLHRFFGEMPAFQFSWCMVLLIRPMSVAVASLAAGKYTLYPILKLDRFCKEFQDEKEFEWAVTLLALVYLYLIAALNVMSAKFATRAAILFLIAKISAMALMIGIGIYNMGQGNFGALENGWDSTDKGVGDIAMSFYGGVFAYDGWNNLNFVTEELKNPHRNLPLAIMIGIPLSTFLYLLINVSYLSVLTKDVMIASEAVAIDVGDDFLGPMKLLIPILVTLAAAGTANGSMFTAGRIAYCVGREGHMVDVMSYVHASRLTPVVAILVSTILGSAFVIYGNIGKLIELAGFVGWMFYGLALASVVVLRFTKSDAPRPFKVPIIIPIITTIMAVALVVLPVAYNPTIEYIAVIGYMLLGVVFQYIFVYRKLRVPYMDEFTRFVQYFTLGVPSPYKED